MTTYLIHFLTDFLLPYVAGASLGFLGGWLTFKRRFYDPLKKSLDMALKGWQETIDLSMKFVKEHKKVVRLEKNENNLILSPFQVHLPGQRPKDEDDE